VHNPRTTNVAREAALHAGLPVSVPAETITAAGASALVAVEHGADLIRAGRAEVVVAGGTDCVSDPPIGYGRAMRTKLLRGRRLRGVGQHVRFVLGLRPWDFLPHMPDVTEFTTGETMGQYCERLARRLGIDRQAQDAYALRSHQRAHAARDHLASEIVAVPEAPGVRDDNGVRPATSLASLARLAPAFPSADGDGSLTAGNSSFLTDGAAAVLLASAERAAREGWTVRARLVDQVLTAHDPQDDLLLGPVFAIPKLLARHDLGLADVDIVELHEAFAAQVLAVIQLLDAAGIGTLDPGRLNAWGGSLALGNPFAPNGARLLVTATHRLQATSPRSDSPSRAVVATCAGGALGSAVLLASP
jgi:acetyl-CoA acyltransferase